MPYPPAKRLKTGIHYMELKDILPAFGAVARNDRIHYMELKDHTITKYTIITPSLRIHYMELKGLGWGWQSLDNNRLESIT